MNIGIVGYGLVGRAVAIGLANSGNTVLVYDIKFDPDDEGLISEIKDAWVSKISLEGMASKCDIIFVCVPTPSREDGSCNTSIVEETISNLICSHYDGIIAIKSTVEPGTTQRLIDQYCTHKILFTPEFLRERYAVQDFIENQDICVIGTDSEEVFNVVKTAHGTLPKKVIRLNPTEAEFVKYYNNIFNATLVTIANSFYELCRTMKVDYSKIKNALVNRDHINDIYLDCNEWLRGFGGMCLPKDSRAIAVLCEKLNLHHIHFFHDILRQNEKYATTVFNGMRE